MRVGRFRGLVLLSVGAVACGATEGPPTSASAEGTAAPEFLSPIAVYGGKDSTDVTNTPLASAYKLHALTRNGAPVIAVGNPAWRVMKFFTPVSGWKEGDTRAPLSFESEITVAPTYVGLCGAPIAIAGIDSNGDGHLEGVVALTNSTKQVSSDDSATGGQGDGLGVDAVSGLAVRAAGSRCSRFRRTARRPYLDTPG